MGSQVVSIFLVRDESVSSAWAMLRKSLADCGSQPIMADEIQMFKALIVVHKVLQEGHPVVLKEAQVSPTSSSSLCSDPC